VPLAHELDAVVAPGGVVLLVREHGDKVGGEALRRRLLVHQDNGKLVLDRVEFKVVKDVVLDALVREESVYRADLARSKVCFNGV